MIDFNNPIIRAIVDKKLEHYVVSNPERLSGKERENLKLEVKNFLLSDDKSVISDEVYDFLLFEKIIKGEPRHEEFVRHIAKKYPVDKYKNLLEVGAGRMCRSASALGQLGYKVTAMDPIIRRNYINAKGLGIFRLVKSNFECDEFATNIENKPYQYSKGTDILRYNVVVANEPCDATEHIIRQADKYDVPFEINLCYAPHKALDGRVFKTVDEWYDHLKSVTNDVEIYREGDNYYATNYMEKE